MPFLDDERSSPPEGDPFASALRAAISERGLTLGEIGTRLRQRGLSASAASLSSWQSGARHPDWQRTHEVIDALEQILDLPVGSLTDLITPRRQGRRPRVGDISTLMPSALSSRDALEELGFVDAHDYPHELFASLLTVIDPAACTLQIDYHLVVRVLKDGYVAMPSVHVLSDGISLTQPRFTALHGCSIGEGLFWPDRRTAGARIEIEGKREAGELAILAYRVEYEAEMCRMTTVAYAVARRAHSVLVDVQVPSNAVFDVIAFTALDDGELTERQIKPSSDGRLQAEGVSFGPGQVGLRWEWTDLEEAP